MKKYFFYAISFLSFFVSAAQDFQGIAYYESKTTMDDDFGPRDMSEEMKKRIQERMKQMFEKTYVLTFNRAEATYLEEEKLETPGQGGFRIPGFDVSGKYYKNIKQSRYTNQREVFGKIFLIKDSLPKLNWKLENETKKIGNYTCYKATAEKPVSITDFRNFRPRRPNDDKGKDGEAPKEDKEQPKDSVKTRSIFDQIEVPKQVVVTAWYTPEIPVNMGPGEYAGLPGLILEIDEPKTTILCSKIVLNPTNKEEIKEPNKGKEVTEQEFADIVKKKLEEMRENFRNSRGGGRMGGF